MIMNKLQDNKKNVVLAEQIRKGDKQAFTELFEAYYVSLCEYAFRMLRDDEEEMEDIVQDLFSWIWKNRERFEPGISVRAYLYRSVYNRVISRIRKKRFESHLDQNCQDHIKADQNNQIEEMQNRELGRAIAEAIQLLPEKRREIIILYLQYELTYKEIASILNISVNTVDIQLRRARKLLCQKLKVYSLD